MLKHMSHTREKPKVPMHFASVFCRCSLVIEPVPLGSLDVASTTVGRVI